MKIARRLSCIMLVAAGVMLEGAPSIATAQIEQKPEFLENEVSLGIGTAVAFEKSPTNIQGENRVSPQFAFSLAYRRHFTEALSAGVHLSGFHATSLPFVVRDNQGSVRNASFSFDFLNLGVQGRYSFPGSLLTPYLFAVINYTAAILSEDPKNTLNAQGLSLGGGAGLNLPVSEHFTLSLEGMATAGWASWREKPFSNSSGREYDPSMIGVFLGCSYSY